MQNANPTLSLKDRTPYAGKKPYLGNKPRRIDNSANKPSLNKATYAHENHLNDLIGKGIKVVFNDASETYDRLIGYDAFSITVEKVRQGKTHKASIFKNQIVAFMAVETAGV